MKSKNKILITGASGFIGINLVEYLSKKNNSLYLIVKNKNNYFNNKKVINKKNIFIANVCDENKIKKILMKIKPTHIIHLASYGNYPEQTDLNQMINTNINGTKNILMASNKIKYKKLIVIGSSSEYGFKNKPMKESDMLTPNSFYSSTKSAATLLAQTFAVKFKKPIVILRLFSVYGPYEKESRLIPTAINSFIKGKAMKITSGKVSRDFIYIGDVIKSIEIFLNTETKPGEIFNIGSGKSHTNDQIINILKQITGKTIKVKKGAFPNREWDTESWTADIKKVKRDIKWSPMYTLKDGLKLSYYWWNRQNEK